MKVQIEESWQKVLAEEFEKDYFIRLAAFLRAEKKAGKIIYPPGPKIFSAFDSTPFDKVKVVLLGQDPYHGPGQAHGLCFSVQKGVPPPPSLVNIYKELNSDLGLSVPAHGFLQNWADQGVLMLNASLTVERGVANSHAKMGWMNFTDIVIQKVSQLKQGVVFILWGNFAKSKSVFIDKEKHFILSSAHPSPFSAGYGFLGSKPFSKTNAYLISAGKEPIDWTIT